MVSTPFKRARHFLLASMLLLEKTIHLFSAVRMSLECQCEQAVLLLQAPTFVHGRPYANRSLQGVVFRRRSNLGSPSQICTSGCLLSDYAHYLTQ